MGIYPDYETPTEPVHHVSEYRKVVLLNGTTLEPNNRVRAYFHDDRGVGDPTTLVCIEWEVGRDHCWAPGSSVLYS